MVFVFIGLQLGHWLQKKKIHCRNSSTEVEKRGADLKGHPLHVKQTEMINYEFILHSGKHMDSSY